MNKIKNHKMRTEVERNKYFFLAMLMLVIASCATDDVQTVARFNDLVLQDEFNTDDFIDTNIWDFEIGTGNNGWGNNELQYYTNRTENASVQNGVLIITAKEEEYNGSGYTSARMITKGEQEYGRFEARIRLPYGQGVWPAFWLLGADCGPAVVWPECGEIDIMEYRGQEPTTVHGSVHGNGFSGADAITKSYSLVNDRFDTDFHVFGIEWTPEYINFYVDDVLYNQITPEDVPGEWVFDHPFKIIINLAVGGSFVGAPNSETVFPQTMLVDYVRVYKRNTLN